jgi:hypothetical protein
MASLVLVNSTPGTYVVSDFTETAVTSTGTIATEYVPRTLVVVSTAGTYVIKPPISVAADGSVNAVIASENLGTYPVYATVVGLAAVVAITSVVDSVYVNVQTVAGAIAGVVAPSSDTVQQYAQVVEVSGSIGMVSTPEAVVVERYAQRVSYAGEIPIAGRVYATVTSIIVGATSFSGQTLAVLGQYSTVVAEYSPIKTVATQIVSRMGLTA